MSWVGPRGVRCPDSSEEAVQICNIAQKLAERFECGVHEILFGYNANPPADLPCKVYALLRGQSASYLVKRNGEWIDWYVLLEQRG